MSNKVGCLIIHGFGGSVDEIAPLSEFLSSRGFKTACPVLKGHSGKRKDMGRVSYNDWIESAEDAFLSLNMQCERIVIIGFSMGGLIGINLAKKYKIAALVTLNTPVYYWDFKRIGIYLMDDLKDFKFVNLRRYAKAVFANPFSALINFRKILAKTISLLQDVKCPIFIAQALKDDTAHYKSADHIYRTVSSEQKDVRYYKNSGHQICLSEDCGEMSSDVLSFIENILKSE